ncbi:chromosomal replication initiator protein DnaA [bacterium]|nr:chromosomal replication initiator protein DnaA [bacterium]
MWKKVSQRIKDVVGANTYKAYFSSTSIKPAVESEKELLLVCPSTTLYNLLKKGGHIKTIERCVEEVISSKVVVSFQVDPTAFTKDSHTQQETIPFSSIKKGEKKRKQIIQTSPFFSYYTFDNFVQGPSNETAVATSLAISKNPGIHYNPLCIYGETGLGKTHIIHAIGQYIKKILGKKVCYFDSQNFMDNYISSISTKRVQQFREEILEYDVLLIDDIQFFSKKEATQNELFFIFNKFHNEGKQIILTSDKYPSEINDMDDRLKSRFSMGVTTEIRNPEYEMRIAIIQKKISLLNIELSTELIEYIAKHIRRNVREIEGALKTLKISGEMVGKNIIDKPFAVKILKNMIKEKIYIGMDNILQMVSTYLKVRPQLILGKGRPTQVVRARQIAIYLSRQLTTNTYENIGAFFGGRSHSTIISSIKKVNELMLENKNIAKIVKKLSDDLNKLSE